MIERDPELSVLLAREALGRKRTDEAEEALRRALSLSHAISTTERHGWITTASFDANGERVLAASRDGTAFIAASDDGRTETTLKGHRGPVASAAFSPDERLVVTASTDGTARVWDAETGAERTVLTGHGDRVSQAAFSGDGRLIATGSKDGTARIWDAETGRQLLALRHPDWVSRVAFTPDGRTLVTACDDGSARIWDARTGELRHVLPGGGGTVLALAVDSRGRLAATGTDGGAVRLWDIRTGRLRHALGGHTGIVAAVAFSPSGSAPRLGRPGRCGPHLEHGDRRPRARAARSFGHRHRDGVQPRRRILATASGNGVARLWDTRARCCSTSAATAPGSRPCRSVGTAGGSLRAAGRHCPRVGRDRGHAAAAAAGRLRDHGGSVQPRRDQGCRGRAARRDLEHGHRPPES